jgi:hypothetical protein
VGVAGNMPFCPKCRDEFQDWVKICPDCNTPLVDKLPKIEKIKHPKSRLTQLVVAPDQQIAHMWAGILENNGIKSVLNTDSSPLTSGGQYFNIPTTIHVIATQARRAKQILMPFLKS